MFTSKLFVRRYISFKRPGVYGTQVFEEVYCLSHPSSRHRYAWKQTTLEYISSCWNNPFVLLLMLTLFKKKPIWSLNPFVKKSWKIGLYFTFHPLSMYYISTPVSVLSKKTFIWTLFNFSSTLRASASVKVKTISRNL